ncbi:MAG TPA: hypothetical protein VID26_03710 [Candidatus Limnocylindrales bacterium]|jgi:hypothetical protein
METDDGNPRLRTFMVECYAPGIQAIDVAADGDRAQAAAEAMRRDGRRIEYVRGLLIPLDEVVFHLFRAQDAGLVREAVSRAAVTCERIVESIVVETGSDARRFLPDGRR